MKPKKRKRVVAWAVVCEDGGRVRSDNSCFRFRADAEARKWMIGNFCFCDSRRHRVVKLVGERRR